MAVQNAHIYTLKNSEVIRALFREIVKVHPEILTEIADECLGGTLNILDDGNVVFSVAFLEFTED